jgi:hypothetical protein
MTVWSILVRCRLNFAFCLYRFNGSAAPGEHDTVRNDMYRPLRGNSARAEPMVTSLDISSLRWEDQRSERQVLVTGTMFESTASCCRAAVTLLRRIYHQVYPLPDSTALVMVIQITRWCLAVYEYMRYLKPKDVYHGDLQCTALGELFLQLGLLSGTLVCCDAVMMRE